MALASRDFTVDQGSTFLLQFTLTDDDGFALPTVTGGTASPQIGNFSFGMKCIRSKYGGNTASLLGISGVTMLGITASSDAGNTRDGFYVFAGDPGRVKVVVSAATTATVKHGRHDYDIEVVETKTGGTEITKAFVGKMTFIAEATN